MSVEPNTSVNADAGRRQLPRTPTPAETGRRRTEEFLTQVRRSYGGAAIILKYNVLCINTIVIDV